LTQFVDDGVSYVPKPSRHAVTLDGIADGLRNDQADLG
jgi:hypothetical protein